MMLNNYPVANMTSIAEIESWLQSDYPGAWSKPSDETPFGYRVNAAQLSRVRLLFSSCRSSVDTSLPPNDALRYLFLLTKPARITIGPRSFDATPSVHLLVPANETLRIEHQSSHDQLALRFNERALQGILESLIGSHVDQLTFDAGIPRDRSSAFLFKQAAIDLANEINELGSQVSPSVLAELEQSFLVRTLLYTSHNYTDLLLKRPQTSAISTLDRAEEFIEENWDKPLDFEKLSQAVDTSIRSLYRTFRQKRNYTPAEYAKRVRLEHARAMIQHDDGTSIMAIALKCGFQNVGRFAHEYRARFGELPSQSRKRSR